MSMRVIDLAQQVIAGTATIEQLFAAVASPVRQELVQRAAVARTFDRGLYEQILCDGLPADMSPIPFDEFIKASDVEAVPYSDGRFWVKDAVRVTALSQWRTSRGDELRALSRSIATYLDQPQFESLAIERLEQLLRCDPDAALVAFERMYRAADRRFHQSRCFALVELLRTMEPEYGGHKDLVRVRQEYRALYQARALFVNEFHQTVRYLHRPVAERRLRRLLSASNGKWIIDLHGPGGVGKTTLLKWFVSHRLVRRRVRVPCVHIDFDAVSLSAVLQFPWLLAIEIASQLDRQLPQSVFGTMSQSFARFRPLLKADGTLSDESEQALRQEAATTDLWPSLLSGLRSLSSSCPIVIMVDTLEDASLHRPDDLMAVLLNLSALHDASPAVRLVLSGRYALGLEHAPMYCDQLRAQTRYVRLRRLSVQESRTLVLRLWADVRDDVREALVKRGRGNPLLLTPLIELTQPDSTITKERILGPEFDDLDEVKMIERVIRRIPAPTPAATTSGDTPSPSLTTTDHLAVRWVVRYGVVPRRLTQMFVAEVLLPFLTRAISGEAEASGDDFIEEIRGERDWRAGPGLSWNAATVWEQLTAYATAGNHGWITVDAGDPPTARLHPDVVGPMRRLLRKQHVYGRLQEAARDYFAARGRTLEVLFHELQLSPERASERWREVLAEARYRNDPIARRQLAEALLAPDFATAPAAAKSLAHYRAAWALAATVNHTLVLPDQIFDLAWQHLDQARTLQAEAKIVGSTTWHCLDVVRLFRGGDREQALTRIAEPLSHSDISAQDRTCLLLHRAEMQVRMGLASESEASFAQALASAASDPRSIVPLWAIHDRLGHRLARRGEWLQSAAHYDAALEGLKDSTYESKRNEIYRAIVMLDLTMGRPARAYARLDSEAADPQAVAGAPRSTPWATLCAQWPDLVARVALALEEPLGATAALQPLERRKPAVFQKADGPLLLGDAYARLLEFDRAEDVYRRGEELAGARGDTASAERCRVARARMYVRVAGALQEAAVLFDSGPMRSLDADPTMHAEWTVLRAVVAERSGRRDEARGLLAPLVADDAQSQSPHQLIYGRFAQLTLKHLPLTNELVRALAGMLETIEPVSARHSLLEAVELGGCWDIAEGVDVKPLLDALRVDPRNTPFGVWPESREREVLSLAVAELLKGLGRVSEMESRLLELLNSPHPWGARLMLRRLTMERQLREDGISIPTAIENGSLTVTEPDPVSEGASAPKLRAALLIELAQAEVANGVPAEAMRLLEKTEDVPSFAKFPTHYDRRRASLRRTLMFDGAVPPQPAAPAAASRGGPAPPADVPRPSTEPVRPPVTAWQVTLSAKPPSYAISSDGNTGLVPEHLELNSERLRYASRTEAPLMASSWKKYGRRLADVLLSAPSAGALQGAPVWLSGEPELSALPWELATAISPDRFGALLRVPGLQGAEPDWPAQTNPTILLLDARYMQEREVIASRAYADLPKVLSAFGARVRLEQRFDRSMIEMLVKDTRPDLIVLVGSLDESTDKEAGLRLGNMVLDVGSLYHALTPFGGDDFLPTVVLDIPAPGSAVEAAAQVLTRNRFAFDLLRRGRLHAVLATGLGSDDAQGQLHELLAKGLRNGDRMERVLDVLRQQFIRAGSSTSGPASSPVIPDSLHEVLPFIGSALFTTSPLAPLVLRSPANA